MAKNNGALASVDSGRTFMGSASGRWAGERLLAALKAGRPLSPSELRTADTLRKEEWTHLDDALVSAGVMRLRGVADLIAAGLTIPIPNAMGKTMIEFELATDMEPAITSLSGLERSEDDRLDFDLGAVPLPITHKDFDINLRTLSASRERGEPLDTMQSTIAGRLVAEQLEKMLFQGGPTYGGKVIYGLTNHPDRNVVDFENNEQWTHASKDGAGIFTDVINMIKAAETDRFFGPYRLYVPSTYSTVLDGDFKANSDLTIRQRLLQIDRLTSITTVDQLPVDNVVLFQATQDVVAIADGEPLQTVQWDLYGGFRIAFKAFAIQVPVIRSTSKTKTATTYSVAGSATTKQMGVVHLSQL